MVWTRQTLTVFGVFLTSQLCQGCVTVFEDETFCVENGEISMACPVSHMIIVKEAVHRVVKSGSCPTDLDSVDACTLLNITAEVSSTCQKMNNCAVSVTDASTACSTYTGNKFVTVSYKCEPEFGTSAKAVSTAFCSNVSWEGSYAYLNNLITPDDATRCLCIVTIPQEVNVLVKLLSLTTATDGKCSPFVNMDEDGQMTDFCTAGELLCKDGGRQLNFEYIPKGQSMSILTISVSHKASFKLQCSINPVTTTVTTTRPTTTTLTTTTTTTPTTTSSTTTTTTINTTPTTTTSTSTPIATTTIPPTSTKLTTTTTIPTTTTTTQTTSTTLPTPTTTTPTTTAQTTTTPATTTTTTPDSTIMTTTQTTVTTPTTTTTQPTTTQTTTTKTSTTTSTPITVTSTTMTPTTTTSTTPTTTTSTTPTTTTSTTPTTTTSTTPTTTSAAPTTTITTTPTTTTATKATISTSTTSTTTITKTSPSTTTATAVATTTTKSAISSPQTATSTRNSPVTTTVSEVSEPTTTVTGRSVILDKFPETYVSISTSETDVVPIIAACLFIIVIVLILVSAILLMQWRKGQRAAQKKKTELEVRSRPANRRSQPRPMQEAETQDDTDTPNVHYVTSVNIDDTAI